MCTPVPPTGHWHEDYERGRPGWPAEVLDVLGLPVTATVLEVGAGTGKLTRLLVGRFDHVIAVEPDEGMRALLPLYAPESEVLVGAAENIPIADASIDALFVGEAFHAFDGDRAVVEFARVLKPEGLVVLMWNIPAGPTTPSIAAAEQLLLGRAPAALAYDPVDLNPKRYSSGGWRVPFANSPFAEFQEARIANAQTIDREGVVAFLESMGWVGHLPESDRLPLLERVRSLLEAPEYHRPWWTHLYWARRNS